MKQDSFYSFVSREISKNSFNRMHLSGFTRLLRKKCYDASSAQLLFAYKELYKMKVKNSKFQLSAKNINDSNRQYNPKNETKLYSYYKHTLICMYYTAIKQKYKSGYYDGFDVCKLLYYRLLNAIYFNLPHAQILDHFRYEFLWKYLDEEIIDYVGLIEKDPYSLGPLYVDTVNNIIQTVSEGLEAIDVLYLPFLKAMLAKGQSFGAYNIDESLLDSLDALIDQNKYVYSFKELGSSLSSDKKHFETHILYSLMSKDLTYKRLNYMMINENNLMNGGQSIELSEEIKTYLGLPGKYLDLYNIEFLLKRITQLHLYAVYIDLFQSVHQYKKITKTTLLRPYIQYHFKYFFKASSGNCKIQYIKETLNNTFESEYKMAQKGLLFYHLEILKLFLICYILSKEVINPEQMHESHRHLQKELTALNLIQKPKIEYLNVIFEKSLQNICPNSKIMPDKCFNTLSKFIKNCEVKLLTYLISEDLSTLYEFYKTIIMNELILSLVKALLNKNMSFDAEVVGKIMDIFMKLQFKKFSTEFYNVYKLLDLIKYRSNYKVENKTD